MAGSNSSVHGENHEGDEQPVTRAEMQQLRELVQAMGQMLNERLPVAGGAGLHQPNPAAEHGEAADENSVGAIANDDFHNQQDLGRGDGRGGGAHRGRGAAAHILQHGGGAHGRAFGHRVRFDDEEDHNNNDFDEEFDDSENPFADDGRYEHRAHRRRAVHRDRRQPHGRRNRDDPDNIARVKLSVP